MSQHCFNLCCPGNVTPLFQQESPLGIPANPKSADCKTLLSAISGLSCLATQLSENLYHRLGSMDEKFFSPEQRLSVLVEKWESGSGIVETHQRK